MSLPADQILNICFIQTLMILNSGFQFVLFIPLVIERTLISHPLAYKGRLTPKLLQRMSEWTETSSLATEDVDN